MSLNRFLSWRYLIAAGLAALAIITAVTLFLPEKASAQALVVKSPICAGCEITASEITPRKVSASLLPSGSLDSPNQAVGQVAVTKLEPGTVIQKSLLLKNTVTDLEAGEIAFSLVLEDPAAASFAKAGQMVEIWGAGDSGEGELVAADVRVLGVELPQESLLSTADTDTVAYLAAPEDEARRVIAAKTKYKLSFVLRG